MTISQEMAPTQDKAEKVHKIMVRCDGELHEQLKEQARHHRMSLNQLCVALLSGHVCAGCGAPIVVGKHDHWVTDDGDLYCTRECFVR